MLWLITTFCSAPGITYIDFISYHILCTMWCIECWLNSIIVNIITFGCFYCWSRSLSSTGIMSLQVEYTRHVQVQTSVSTSDGGSGFTVGRQRGLSERDSDTHSLASGVSGASSSGSTVGSRLSALGLAGAGSGTVVYLLRAKLLGSDDDVASTG